MAKRRRRESLSLKGLPHARQDLAFAVALASPLAFTAACAATGNAPQTQAERSPVGAAGQAVLVNASGANIGRVDLRHGPTGW